MTCTQHHFDTYGQTTYGKQTCRQCLLQAYHGKSSNIPRMVRSAEGLSEQLTRIKVESQTPMVDTISHYPSPGGEAICGVYQPHLPLLNCEDEIRPKDVSEFMSHCSPPSEELLKRCKSPWEKDEKDPQLVADMANNKNVVMEKSLVEKTLDDTQYIQHLLQNRQKLHKYSTEQFYKTSTQRMYEGADWRNKVSPSNPPPIRPFNHDTKQLDKRIMRYKEHPQNFQIISGVWDQSQSRAGNFHSKPYAYCSIAKKSSQIPNYQGMIGGHGEKDIEKEKFEPLTVLRTQQPKYQETSKKPFIPGYTGCTLWSRSYDVFSKEKLPRVESTASCHRRFTTYPGNASPFSHKSPLSKSVSLTHPFVPYNKVDYALNKTASGSRIY